MDLYKWTLELHFFLQIHTHYKDKTVSYRGIPIPENWKRRSETVLCWWRSLSSWPVINTGAKSVPGTLQLSITWQSHVVFIAMCLLDRRRAIHRTIMLTCENTTTDFSFLTSKIYLCLDFQTFLAPEVPMQPISDRRAQSLGHNRPFH